MRHVFISYSHKDTKYAHSFAGRLQEMGFEVWIDERLDYGSAWPQEIQKQLDSCTAFIVIMSPRSFESEWVQNELGRAMRQRKRIFPLLLEGDDGPWLSLESTQYADVRGGKFPEAKFYIDLEEVVPRKGGTIPHPLPHKPADLPKSRNIPLFAGIGVVALLILGGLLYGINGLIATGTVTVIPDTITPEPPTATPSTDITDGYGVQMALVPAGDFTMGSNSGEDDERPAHLVSVPSFYIDKYEVTNKLYKACVDAGRCTPPQNLSSTTRPDYFGNPEFDDFPVIYVNWEQAKAYCNWRSALLPSESQWEKAALGTTGFIYPWGNEINGTFANYDGAFRRDTSKVGSYELGRSVYGVYDMVGNVWEWTSSLYIPYPYRVDERENPNTPGERVVRGGSWYDHTAGLRSSDRYGDGVEDVNDGLGFRCAREAYP